MHRCTPRKQSYYTAHCFSMQTVESSKPTLAVVIAAPIMKLCSARLWYCRPAFSNASSDTPAQVNIVFVSDFPLKMKKDLLYFLGHHVCCRHHNWQIPSSDLPTLLPFTQPISFRGCCKFNVDLAGVVVAPA